MQLGYVVIRVSVNNCSSIGIRDGLALDFGVGMCTWNGIHDSGLQNNGTWAWVLYELPNLDTELNRSIFLRRRISQAVGHLKLKSIEACRCVHWTPDIPHGNENGQQA